LQDFLRNPVRHFFSQRLKVFFEAAEVPLADEEPFVLDALQRYSLSDSLLDAALTQPAKSIRHWRRRPGACKTVGCCRWQDLANAFSES
jgi:exonuclease V gamma subunit